MDNDERAALKAAADKFAATMKTVAAMRSRKASAAVNVTFDGGVAVIRAGHPGGEWGWDPIVAFMFDNNWRHPLYGNKRVWYNQGRFPISSMTQRAGIEGATEAFADKVMETLFRDWE